MFHYEALDESLVIIDIAQFTLMTTSESLIMRSHDGRVDVRQCVMILKGSQKTGSR